MTVTLGICRLNDTPDRRTASAEARRLLARMLSDAGLALPSPLPIEKDANGRPFLTGLTERVDFSISHAGRYVACALAVSDRGNARVGVDVEIPHERTDRKRLAERFFAPAEIAELQKTDFSMDAFLSVWTKKEAYLKFTGTGLAGAMQTADTTAPDTLSVPAALFSYRLPDDGDTAVALALPLGVTPPKSVTLYPAQ